MLRWASSVIYFMRTAVGDTELGGTSLTAGDHVVLLYASANHDEAVFGPTTAEFDIARSPNPHLAFGFGTHYIGAALARQEIAVVLDQMLDRYARARAGRRCPAHKDRDHRRHPRRAARAPLGRSEVLISADGQLLSSRSNMTLARS